jgi:hypothetical protein
MAGKVAGEVAGKAASGFAAGAADAAAKSMPKVPGVGEVTRLAKGLVGSAITRASGAVSKVTSVARESRANARKKAAPKG